jgi:hypothetical protein
MHQPSLEMFVQMYTISNIIQAVTSLIKYAVYLIYGDVHYRV